jgi:hypothetical protein
VSGCELVVNAGRDSAGLGREVDAADPVRISVGVVAAAECRGPHVPALRRRGNRCLVVGRHSRVSRRDVGRQIAILVGRELSCAGAETRPTKAGTIAIERVEHQQQEFVHQLIAGLLRAASIVLAFELGERLREQGWREVVQVLEPGRQIAAGVDERVERAQDVLLIDRQVGYGGQKCLNEVEVDVVRIVAQYRSHIGSTDDTRTSERTGHWAAGGGQDRIFGSRRVVAGTSDDVHGAADIRAAADVGLAGGRGRDLDQIDRGARHSEIAVDGDLAGRQTGRQRAAVIDGHVRNNAGAIEHGPGVHGDAARRRDIPGDGERAAIDRGRPGVVADAAQDQRS